MRTTRAADPLVDANVIGEYLGVSYQTVCRWAGERRIPSVKIGGALRFRMSAIEEWVMDHEREARAS